MKTHRKNNIDASCDVEQHDPLTQNQDLAPDGFLKSYQNDAKFSFHKQTSTESAPSSDSSESAAVTHSRNGNSLKGRLLLTLVAFLYGSLNVCLRWIYELPGPPSASALSSARGWLAAACFIPLLARRPQDAADCNVENRAIPPSMWRVGAELAFFNFGAQALLTLGLLTTQSARASFLTQTSVVMTPVLSAVAGQRLHWPVWVGCGMAMAGLVLISGSGGVLFSFGRGDLLVLTGAFCWSCYLFRLSSVGESLDEIQLQGVKTFLLAIIYSIWFIGASIHSEECLWLGWNEPYAWLLLFYSAAGPGTFADIIQQMGQATVSASEANVILSLEPVFTAILGLLLLGEATTVSEAFGGVLIVSASIISSY